MDPDDEEVACRLSDKGSLERHNQSKGMVTAERLPRNDTNAGARHWVGRIITSTAFDLMMTAVIIANLVLVILEADAKAAASDLPFWLVQAAQGLLWFYVAEICARLFVWRCEFFEKNENIFDFALVSVDLVFFVLDLFIGDRLPPMAILRILRLAKLSRMTRVLNNSRELYVIMAGLGGAMRAMMWGCVLLFVVLLLWAIVATEVLHPLVVEIDANGGYNDCARCTRAFSSVMGSMLTFVQHTIVGDSWSAVCMPLIETNPWTALPLVAVVLSINLGILNLLLSAIVDNANEARSKDEQRKIMEKNKDFADAATFLKQICVEMDVDHSGQLTLDELMEGYVSNPEFFKMMHVMDVEKEDMRSVFKMLDSDRSGSVTCDEFVEQIHKMKTQDLHSMLVFIKCHVQETQDKLTDYIRAVKEDIKEHHGFEMRSNTLRFEASLSVLERLTSAVSADPPSPSAPVPPGDADAGGGASGKVRFLERVAAQTEALSRQADRLSSHVESLRLPAASRLPSPPVAFGDGCGGESASERVPSRNFCTDALRPPPSHCA